MLLDISLSDNIVETNIFSAALQELDIIFTTLNTELIGYPDFGCDFEQFLWTLTPCVGSLQKYINDKLSNSLFISQLHYNVNVEHSFNEEEYQSVYNVYIYLYDDTQTIQKHIKLGK